MHACRRVGSHWIEGLWAAGSEKVLACRMPPSHKLLERCKEFVLFLVLSWGAAAQSTWVLLLERLRNTSGRWPNSSQALVLITRDLKGCGSSSKAVGTIVETDVQAPPPVVVPGMVPRV